MIALQGTLVGKTVTVMLLFSGEAKLTVERITSDGLFGTYEDGTRVFVFKHAIAAIDY